MASFINTNMASLNTQRNLSASQAALNTSIQRLSSGMRVNSAKDDAAGMAIASRMDSMIKGQTVAMRNANDAISFSQTAEGAMSKITDNLQRMRELAVQAANGTNGDDDRTSLNTEFKQLQSEITRITSTAKFNGISVLDGKAQTFQVGSGTTDADKISLTDAADLTAASSATQKAAANTGANDGANLAYAKVLADTTGDVTADTVDGNKTYTVGGITMTQNKSTGAISYADSSDATVAKTAGDFAEQLSGLTLTTDQVSDSKLATAYAAKAAYGTNSGTDILTQDKAQDAMNKIDAALKEVNTESIKHGANQNRFQAVISTLQVSVENQTSARSRIMDTDFAAETATMARGQILQQAGMAMLAQANQLPNGVMALLR